MVAIRPTKMAAPKKEKSKMVIPMQIWETTGLTKMAAPIKMKFKMAAPIHGPTIERNKMAAPMPTTV